MVDEFPCIMSLFPALESSELITLGLSDIDVIGILDYGLELKLFNIEAIPIIDDDPKVKKIIEDYQRIMAEDAEERMRLKRRADNLDVYKVERSFDTSEKVAENKRF